MIGIVCTNHIHFDILLGPSHKYITNHQYTQRCTSEMIYASIAVLGLLASASGKIYFKEGFNDKAWETRWTTSEAKVSYLKELFTIHEAVS